MNSKALRWMLSVVAVVILALGISVRAQAPTPTHFSGLINDYTPETILGKVVGPWEMHGKWSLDLKGRSGLADFSAEMTMEQSDHAMEVAIANALAAGTVPPSFDDPETRIPHTHHVTMKDAKVSVPAAGVCPPYAAPAPTTPGIMVSGSAYITGNGGPAPFSKNDTVLSMLQVCVNGGTDVPFSNVSLVFGAPASGHFGMSAIHGVVRERRFDQDDH
ncbi:MAG: hypothetical protein WCC97_18585 [Candidatus Acidiferrales bacterium]